MEGVTSLSCESQAGAAGGEFVPEISEGAFALVKQWRGANLLAKARQPHIRQALDRIEEGVDSRLREYVETEVGPELVHLREGAGLNVLSIFALEKITHQQRIALVADHYFGGQVRAERGFVGEPDALALPGERLEV